MSRIQSSSDQGGPVGWMTPDDVYDEAVLAALDRVCVAEPGGWASSGAVAEAFGDASATSMGNRLHRLARMGRVDTWVPRASRHYRLTLFRRAVLSGDAVKPNRDHPLYLKTVMLRGAVVEVFGDEEAMIELADENGQTIELITVPLDQVALDERGPDAQG